MMYTCLFFLEKNIRLISKILISKKFALTFEFYGHPVLSGILFDGNKKETIYKYVNSKD